jgi:UDP-N-acetylmuramoyl-L-alanyl-D-glutamate--2,6-diaminopimelate ligase
MQKTLSQLLENIPGVISASGDTVITSPVVEADAEILPGGVFVARQGMSIDGHQFIPRAIERGAAAIVGEQPLTDLSVPYVQVENAQEAVGYLAAAYHDHPSRKLTVIGVTGTDGKTTTSTLIHSILRIASGGRAGLISTVAADLGGQTVETGLHVTTPGAPQVQALLAQMAANGLTHVVLEMTSHGLAQGRLNGVALDAAVLTNLTHEHLDYHKTFENYRAAKARMFTMLNQSPRKPGMPKLSVINADDANAAFFAEIPTDRIVHYSLNSSSDFRATDIVHRPGYTQFVLHSIHPMLNGVWTVPLVGDFNIMNTLAAIATARSLGIVRDTIQQGILNVPVIPGRMERIDEGQPFLALVDFAHTPNSLQNALRAARSMIAPEGRVIVVFGCAGLRDREKRQMMPRIAAELADFSIFTAEDPRTESLDAILQTMADSAVSAGALEGKQFIRIPDRGEALYQACQYARAGDIVIACGKGHEQSMAFGTVEYPWDDREGLRAALQGEPLKTLPTTPSAI